MSMHDEPTLHLNVLLVQEDDGWWSAQCLEYDIATQAKNLADLRYEMEKTLIAHLAISESQGLEIFQGLGPAPKEYWRMFDDAKLRVESDPPLFRALKPMRPIPKPHFRVAESRTAA